MEVAYGKSIEKDIDKGKYNCKIYFNSDPIYLACSIPLAIQRRQCQPMEITFRPISKDSIPAQGVYMLWLYLPAATEITIGKLGTFDFPAGIYFYCGSAQRNLAHRIKRHERSAKKLHWHIDYFWTRARYLCTLVFPEEPKDGECLLAERLLKIPGAFCPVKGFGSSDCKCESHLIKVPIK